MTVQTFDPIALFDWLAESSLKGRPVDVLLTGFCERLDGGGFGLCRGHVSVATVHPAVNAYSVTWRRASGIERTVFGHGETIGPGWQSSPFHHMLSAREPVLRRRLTGPAARLDFPVLRELQAAGMTDWFATLVSFNWTAEHIEGGQIGAVTSWASDRPEGFTDAQLAALQRLVGALAAAIKSATINDIAHEVLAAYVGRDAANRVLSGAITRGSVQRLHAVLFFADLRGFTRLSAGLPTGEVVSLLNDVFERVAAPIRVHGGEILKFIGDGLLAVFLLDGRRSIAATADAALEAAIEAQRSVRLARAPLALDIALHLGEVHYGNVGAADRLDFTVIGAAVNEVARLEELCGTLNEPVLVSATLRAAAQAMVDQLISRGRHDLRGIEGPREVFALPVARG